MIKQILDQNGNLSLFFRFIEENKKISLMNLGDGEIVGVLDEINRPKLFIASNKEDAIKFKEKFENLNYRVNCCTNIPELFLSDYTVNAFSYIDFVRNIKNEYFNIHITTPEILMLQVPSNINDHDKVFEISIDQQIDIDELLQIFNKFGYKKVNSMAEPGDYVCKGEVIDFITYGSSVNYRIVFDFDVIEKLYILDSEGLNVAEKIGNIILSSNKYLEPQIELINKHLYKSSNKELIKIYENYLEFNKLYNSLWFMPFANSVFNSFYNILPEDMVVIFSDTKKIWDKCNNLIEEYNEKVKDGVKNGLLLKCHSNPLKLENILANNIKNTCIAFHFINNSNKFFNPNSVFSFKCMPNISYGENYSSLIIDLDNYNKLKFTTLLFVDEDNYNQLISKIRGKINFNECTSTFNIQKNSLNIIKKIYNNSFNFFDEKFAVIGSGAVGKVYKTPIVKNIETSDLLAELELPKENDFVVHKIHGIGKCLGIQNLQLSKDEKKDYIVIEYKNEDKLYLPIENVDSITKYIGDNELPALNKLGGTEFKRIKDKIKSSVKDIANDLIAIYKERESLKGYKYPEDDDIQIAFEKDFPFELTYDQQKTIDEIKSEMISGKLIDRLVCGDVGFGKTEVALRISFKTLLAGRNVAVLCPTTILSEQHYATFSNRMQKYGINVKVLNRFRSVKETNAIIEDLNSGKVNLIIGTHKLLNSKIKFNNLGLLIIDEEQKFGVEHKEKIKALKKEINVLTLSATPIPRTLHLSLSGIRDISTIQTPPNNKISTTVNVLEYSDYVIRMAIEKEIERGGQVLVIYNRVDYIEEVANNLKQLLNNKYVIDIAHGQMSTTLLEDKILNLYNGKTQILVSTTLIENGVDLPNANTLIILDSDKLGLSQLYQLKGRVGRGSRDSFAYFMYSGILTDIAYKRLKAISEYTAMGSGFKISMCDMQLRGAGNIFGAQQHGHLEKIGYALYMAILNNTIEEIKTNTINNKLYHEIKIDTDLPTNIPNSSNFNTNQKMSLYSKIAKINNEKQFSVILTKIQELYNDLPESLVNLCKFSLIKNRLYKYNAKRLIVKKNDVRIVFDDAVNLETISKLINNNIILELKNGVSLVVNGIPYNSILDFILSVI